MNIPTHDVLIVGGGGAGLRAAVAAVESDPSLDVGLISKVYPMRSHTVSAEGGAAAVMRDDDSLDSHAFDTIKGSDFLADQDVVEAFVEEAPRELIQLEHWGCPWSREPDGRISVRAFGGMSTKRTCYAADKTGFHMLHALFQNSLRYDRIHRYDEWFVTSLLQDEGRVAGVAALNLLEGGIHAIPAKAVILCTGGGGRVFPFTTNAAIKTGDGMSMAYRAGCPLKDMEFVQYHPTGLPGTGILMTEASRGEGGHMINSKGERYLSEYVPGKMELGPRDILSRAFIHERSAGRVFQDEDGEFVHLDLRHLGEKTIDEKLPFVRELTRNYVGIDPVYEPIPVRPVVHYMMGGVHTNINGATPIPGLFAAGETACISLNGANRLGSNSLTECLVFGARAGLAAVAHASKQKKPLVRALEALARDEEEHIESTLLSTDANRTERVSDIRTELQKTMEDGAGIYRTSEELTKACERITKLRERYQRVRIDDHSSVFNTQLTAALELGCMLDVAESLAHSARLREESRGSHARSDFEARDDEHFLQHSLAYHVGEGADPRIEYLPATITRWQPEERTY
ncbi:MAG: FAD-binding protein [Candidatus Latescibacterota bacterium]|nr:FAD-binding protein [Candidatus Latescibacterota bacterium]